MFKITFYLKSGQSVDAYVESLTIKKNLGGDFASMDWVSVDQETNLPRLMKINIEDISAITSTLQKTE